MQVAYEDIISFHGHSCPGLAMGYRMAQAALDHLKGQRAEDEELVAIVENDACGVDALQVLTGCTFGKGNLLFKDYGKHVYTLYYRETKSGVRVRFRSDNITQELRDDREQYLDWILTAPEAEVVAVRTVDIAEPEPARIMDSVPCAFCHEYVMETRTKAIDGRPACIPCAAKQGAA